MKCSIKWNSLALENWRARFATVRRAPLLQVYEYALAMCPLHRQRARWGIVEIDGAEAGLVQIQEASVFKGLIHALILDCGPVWFDGFGTEEQTIAFFKEFNRQFPRRALRKRRIIPAAPFSDPLHRAMQDMGYRTIATPGYETIWIDLTQDEADLWAGMKPAARNKVNKGKKSGLNIEWDQKGAFFPDLLRKYQSDRVHKGYKGPSVMTMNALFRAFSQLKSSSSGAGALIGRAKVGEECVAAILIFVHSQNKGAAATYQIGWSSEDGKKRAAHNLLLWEAMLRLKASGVGDFDLGGINDGEAKGVKHFKEGFGGGVFTSVGHYD